MFDCSPVFQRNYQSTAQVVINQGGTDSGKTYALIQLLYLFAIQYKRTEQEPEMLITVVGESIPNLKKGAYRIAENIYIGNEQLRKYVADWNKSDRVITFKNGAKIEFNSYQTPQQAKQGKRQYAFFNEAQGVSWPIFWQIAKRTRKQVFLDYNPTAPFWAHDNLIGTSPEQNDLRKTVELIISDHRHNPFLTQQEHDQTENIKDKELWRVYARGKTGNLTGIIYPNWTRIPDIDFPDDENFIGGCDWGYTNDPTAGTKIVRRGDKIFLKELCYEAGRDLRYVAEDFKLAGFTRNNIIYCDHDDENVLALQRLGLTAVKAQKGPGTIKNGIECLKKFDVYYTESSHNIHEERKRYVWETDKTTGRPLNTPIDGWDHLLSAARYGAYTHYGIRMAR